LQQEINVSLDSIAVSTTLNQNAQAFIPKKKSSSSVTTTTVNGGVTTNGGIDKVDGN
jgi:hypothetical protein